MSGYFTEQFEKVWRKVTSGLTEVNGVIGSPDETVVSETEGSHPSQPEEPTMKMIAKFNWRDFKSGDVVEAYPDHAFDEIVWVHSKTEKRLVAFHRSHFSPFHEVNL